MTQVSFPSGFVWGVATASYQIEGAARDDGRGESIWDRFSHTPGKIVNGDTGDAACDHYHRYREDVAIMRELGLKAYRFSVAWPRILPQGTGQVNEAGLAFYDRLVDALLEARITPFATLYHWDLPQALQDQQGGWASRAIVDQFVHYADIVSRRLGDRVKYWTTFNEPQVFTTHGYVSGEHAPGLKNPAAGAQVAHHVLLAHGKTVPVLRANAPGTQIGIVYDLSPVEAASGAPELLARQRLVDARKNRWFSDPIFLGRYPEELLESPDFAALKIEPGDMEIIRAPVDFLGANYYSRVIVRGGDSAADVVPVTPGGRREANGYTAMGWEIYPQGLYDVLKRLNDDYRPKAIYITESGAAFTDVVGPDGRIRDERRVAYLRDHFRVAQQAIQDGIPLRGYFVWSLLDNFEWAYGYGKRFGIIRVDFATGERRWKDSAHFYQAVIRANAVPE
jgi:beta-glucosidase